MTKEYRVVCANHGQRGHSTHAYRSKDTAKALDAVARLEAHASAHPATYYAFEIPYRAETREVSNWIPITTTKEGD